MSVENNKITKKISKKKMGSYIYPCAAALFAIFNFNAANAEEIEDIEWLSKMMEVPVDKVVDFKIAQANIPIPLKPSIAAPKAQPTSEIEIVVPFSERGIYLGDIDISIQQETPMFYSKDVARLLKTRISPSMFAKIEELGAGGRISISQLKEIGIDATWDPALLSIDTIINANDKIRREIEVSELERKEIGQYQKPANFALYSNIRTSLDYQHLGSGKGLKDPFIDFELNGRILGMAFDNNFSYDTNGFGLSRELSRFVIDNEAKAIRAFIGDVRPQTRAYQDGYDLVGISIFSAYSTLQPLRNLRPRGEGSFILNEPSKVDVIINGRVVRRLELDSGSYDLKDFPFLNGQNRVQFIAEDRTGRRELAKFDIFFDRDLLMPGLSEWSFSLGSTTKRTDRDIIYNDGKIYGSGYYRRGINSGLTIGGNLQFIGNSGIIGSEAVFANKIGVFGFDFANSWSNSGNGNAINLTYNRSGTKLGEKNRSSWGLAFNMRSINFGSDDDSLITNNEDFTASAFWSRTLGQTSNLSFSSNYTKYRNTNIDKWDFRIGIGKRISSKIGINADINYSNNNFGKDFTFRIQISSRFGKTGTMSTSYESLGNRFGSNAQYSGQSKYGNWSINGDVDISKNAAGINAGGFFSTTRADLGISHSTAFDSDFTKVTSERSSMRISTAIGFADGVFAWGRPISNAFAVAVPHNSLKNRRIKIDFDRENGYVASKVFGPPLIGNLPNYTKRDIPVDVEDLPEGYDLGLGSITVRPKYNSGYKLIIGSDDNITIFGKAYMPNNEIVSLTNGTATRKSDGKKIETFTNSKGQFSLTGVGPGVWELIFDANPEKVFIELKIDKSSNSLLKLGDLKGKFK